MEKLLDLGSGLKIARVNIEELREQDLNARSMDSKMFERLTANIKNDQRLESLPFVAETDAGLEIVSGHHRVRACRSAGVTEIFIILDDTGLSRSKIRSKQLSHNSIQGEDNQQLVKEIYALIDDAEDKLAAYIDAGIEEMFDKVTTKDVTFDLSVQTVLVNFMSYEREVFERVADRLNATYDAIYAADLASIDPFMAAIKRVGKEYDIRAMNTTFSKMAEIVQTYLGDDVEEDERVALRDIFKSAYVPAESADVIRLAIEKAEKDGDITKNNRWQLIEYLCGDYLSGK